MQTISRINPAAAPPARRQSVGDPELRLNVCVVFTSVEATLAALRKAGALANKLGARITLIVPEVVSYQLPLHQPAVNREWDQKRLRVLAGESAVETEVKVYLCRDEWETLAKVLKPHSLVVVGGRKRLWPTRESRLAKKLGRLGHEVIFTETESFKCSI